MNQITDAVTVYDTPTLLKLFNVADKAELAAMVLP